MIGCILALLQTLIFVFILIVLSNIRTVSKKKKKKSTLLLTINGKSKTHVSKNIYPKTNF